MLTRAARLVILAIALILLLWTVYERVYELSWAIAFGMVFIIWSYFKHGTVVLASRAYHRKDLDKAEKLLLEISDPDWLSRKRRGFYEFIYGSIELHRGDYKEAEKHFQIATKFPLRNDNDKAFVHIHLANLSLRKKDFERAQAYADKAKTYKITSRVEGIIKNIEQEVKKNTTN